MESLQGLGWGQPRPWHRPLVLRVGGLPLAGSGVLSRSTFLKLRTTANSCRPKGFYSLRSALLPVSHLKPTCVLWGVGVMINKQEMLSLASCGSQDLGLRWSAFVLQRMTSPSHHKGGKALSADWAVLASRIVAFGRPGALIGDFG
jgi:hypothetical protein